MPWLTYHENQSRNFSPPQFLEPNRLRKARRLDGDAQRTEYAIRAGMGSASWHPEIHFLGRQILNRSNLLSGENVDLLIVELGNVLEIVLNAREGRITLQRSEHVRLDDPDIDPSCEDDVGDVLKSALSDHGKNPQVVPNSIETNGEIGSLLKTSGIHAARHHADEPGIYLFSNCMADLRSWRRPDASLFFWREARARRWRHRRRRGLVPRHRLGRRGGSRGP